MVNIDHQIESKKSSPTSLKHRSATAGVAKDSATNSCTILVTLLATLVASATLVRLATAMLQFRLDALTKVLLSAVR